jgi:ABC-type oligopeptide transport system substrate-binding subunit
MTKPYAKSYDGFLKVRLCMYRRVQRTLSQRSPGAYIWLCILLFVLSACGGGASAAKATQPAAQQILTFPNVGITDPAVLDPALGPDQNSQMIVNMVYSGLVRLSQDATVLPDQASHWQISHDQRVYTFTLRPGVKFSNGRPVTAQSYVYSWTRALLPAVSSPTALPSMQMIEGAASVHRGKTQTLSGVRALDDHTLQVTLQQPTPYFLTSLTQSVFFPVNQKLVTRYGQKNWSRMIEGNGVGTGPFMVKQWQHNVRMVFVPNPHYYGRKLHLDAVNMYFVNDPSIAFEMYRAGQTDMVWDLPFSTLGPASMQAQQWETDSLFFNTKTAPFNNLKVRQAFAHALDKSFIAHTAFKSNVKPAYSLLPPGIPGYQFNYTGLPYDRFLAKGLLQPIYPDATSMPPVTFSYPSSYLNEIQAAAIQQMLEVNLGIQVNVQAIEPTAYDDMMQKHLIQFGFVQWGASLADPYAYLVNLLSTSSHNPGQWSNASFDQTLQQAEQVGGMAHNRLCHQAEQIALSNVALMPLDTPTLAMVHSPKVHGVEINGNGLYFGDWGDVYMSA